MSDETRKDEALADVEPQSRDGEATEKADAGDSKAEARGDEPKSEAPEGERAQAQSSAGTESATSDTGSDVQEAEKPKKRKRSKLAAEAAAKKESGEEPQEAQAGRPLDAKGRERPLFLTEFPDDPELARLVAAFEAGNYAFVRTQAEALAERTTDPTIRDAALELRRRIDPDPLIKYLLGLAVALLLFLVFYTYHLH